MYNIMAMEDNASYSFGIYFDQDLPDLGEDPPHRPTFFLRFELARFLALAIPETTSFTLVRRPVEVQRWAIPGDEISAEFIGYAVAQLRLPLDFSANLASNLSFHLLTLADNQLFDDEAVVPIVVRVAATMPYAYDESLEIDRATSESAEAGSDQAVTKPASGSAIAALKEASLEKDADDSICTVCLEKLAPLTELEGDGVAALRLPCSHVYHKDCIVRWLESSHLCPLCRYAMPT